MELVGYSCRHPEPPLRHSFVPLAPLTVLLGPNDSGKSSLLRAIARDLSGGHYANAADRDERTAIGGVFFAVLSDYELDEIIRQAQRTRRRAREDREGHLGWRAPWGLGGWNEQRFDGTEGGRNLSAADWLAFLKSKAPNTVGFEHVLDQLAESRLVSFEPAGVDDHGQYVWNVCWCLPAQALDEATAAALEASELLPWERERARKRRAGRAVGEAMRRGTYIPFYGLPAHMWAPGAPTVIAPIGQTTTELPLSLHAPTEFSQVRALLADAINDVVVAARFAMKDAQDEGDELALDEQRARAWPRSWLQAEDDALTWKVSAEAVAACRFITAAANRALPGFLVQRYRLVVRLPYLTDWLTADSEPLSVVLQERRTDSTVPEFPIEEVADGFRLWLQLALLQACGAAERAALGLRHLATEWFDNVRGTGFTEEPDDDDVALANHFSDLFSGAVEEMSRLDPDERPWLTEYAEWLAPSSRSEASSQRGRHDRLLIVDEPERHLHPRLQREAAVWLKELAVARQSPCVVATHSTPFLALPADPDNLLYVYADRKEDDVRLQPFDPSELDFLDAKAGTLGFDRGELLTTVAEFLVVEGLHELLVLNAVFGGELRRAHIELLSMEGMSNYKAVLDSDALWRFTTAEVALCTDKFDLKTLQQIVADPAESRKLRRGDADEETKVLGKLIDAAQRNGKRIHLIGHPGHDLIDVLDEEVVRSVFSNYPGHNEAQRLWDDEELPAAQRKRFYEEQFGIPRNAPLAYGPLGQAHAEAGVKPPALQAVVDAAVAIALGDEAQRAVVTVPPPVEPPTQ